MVLTQKDEVAGLPQSALDAAAMRAKEKGHDGAYLFDLSYPSMIAFLQYAFVKKYIGHTTPVA